MTDIRPMPATDLERFTEIVANAYPRTNLNTPDDRQRFRDRMAQSHTDYPHSQLYGLYRDGQLLGGMRLFDWTMHVFESDLLAGGVGLVAVDLAHKKEKIARDLITFFLTHYHAKGAPLATLYPFRPDFYREMGFGYGTKLNQYRIAPATLPSNASKEGVRWLGPDDQAQLLECYNRYAARTHGMIRRTLQDVARFVAPGTRLVGYERDGVLEGYLLFNFVPGHPNNFTSHILEVDEWLPTTPAAVQALLAFLRSQADQVETIVLNTLDDDFHHILFDPRNDTGNLMPHAYHESNIQGVGLMYRVLDTVALFGALADHRFGINECRLKLVIEDSFFPVNNGATVVHFADGRPTVQAVGSYDLEVRLDNSDFSALVMGCVPFHSLYSYGRASISDPQAVATVSALFATPTPPVCLTRF